MAKREEEKRRRREERLARERAEAAAAARRQRLQWAGGGLLALAAVAVVVVLAVGALGGSDEGGAASDGVKLPPQRTTDLDAAAKAAGCKLTHPELEGRGHDTRTFKPSDYETNPPTSGTHFPQWYQDGIYKPGTTPNLGMLVHTLEHGRIDVQYAPGTPRRTVQGLEALLAEQQDGYHMLLFENTTDMKAAVAATAWGQSLTCPEMNDRVYDAIRTFRTRYIDKGPEQIP